MEEVYRAGDTRPALSRDVAIKILLGATADDESRRRFEQEARATSALNYSRKPNGSMTRVVGVSR